MSVLTLPPPPPTPTAPDLSKFKSYGILENPMWIEWGDSMPMFFVHEKGQAHESQPWKMPLETLKRMQCELKLQAGSAIDFRRLPQERRDSFARYIDCMVQAFADGKDMQERMDMAKRFNTPPALDDPELDRAAEGLMVDVDMATGGSKQESTSPSYSPTSPSYPPPPLEGFMRVQKRQLEAPANWREAWTDEDMNKLLSEVAYMTETTNEMILDIHHGNVELSRVTPRMGLGTYAKYLQPKNGVDHLMGKLLDKCAEHDPPAKRSRSGSPRE